MPAMAEELAFVLGCQSGGWRVVHRSEKPLKTELLIANSNVKSRRFFPNKG